MRTVLYFIICVVIQQTVSAQAEYLYQLGKKDSLYSETLKESRDIYIQLPYNYQSKPNKSYPVAYILDGELLLPTVSNVHNFYSGGFIPEMILVGISNSKNRTRDLTPSKISTKYGMPFTEENGKAETFLKFIELELIPYIENKYPVTSYRTLMGHSYGGLFTIYTLMNKPKLFSNYLAIDPSLDWDNQKFLKQVENGLAAQNFRGKSLFMTLSGQLHMQNSKITIDNVMQDSTDFTLFSRSNILFSKMVRDNKQNELFFNWKFYPKDIHGTVVFPSIMDGLISMFDWFQMENTDKINSFETSKEDLFSIIKNRENKLKNHFSYLVAPYPEELLNMSGYMNLETHQQEKAKMYFELATQYYPNSTNAYDSLAEYYETVNDYSNALKCVLKAYDLSGDNVYKKRIETLRSAKNEN